MITRIFPFLAWIKDFNAATLRHDLIAGITVALVLIPQSMAYAQLAGLPAYYGLYAAFLPPMVAALFGSSRQLATGPVAVVSLMSAASLEPLATAGGEAFIAYSILLALIVGVFQFTLGVLRLGVVVNFLAHPVVNGFTNAAAIIIATSQLSKLFGVYVDKAEHHYETIINVIRAAVDYTHWPTLGLAVLAFGTMYGLKRLNPKIPNVLVAVVITTVISWVFSFERTHKGPVEIIRSPGVISTIQKFNRSITELEKASGERASLGQKLSEAKKQRGPHSLQALEIAHKIEKINLHITDVKEDIHRYRKNLRGIKLLAVEEGDSLIFFVEGNIPDGEETIGHIWRLKVGNTVLDEEQLSFTGGGAVVGRIPEGLPSFSFPQINFSIILTIFPAAAIISLLGFMEAISIAKAMAARTGQRLDPNQELVGQGLANITGSIGQSYSISGSFSRSAVNIQAGAVSGLSSVFTSGVVVITLLFFTPLLYHLPQAVLAAVIMMAVIGLVNVKGFVHSWHAQKYDGITSVITFVCTLAFAPHLDKGIMVGVIFSLGHYLIRTMKPRVAVLARHDDGTLRDADLFGLKRCEHITVIRFDGSLFFANTSYLEDQVLERISAKPHLKQVLIIADGINELDASGEEMLSLLVDRLRDRNLDIFFSGLKSQIIEVMKRTRLYEKIGEDRFFRTEGQAFLVMHDLSHIDTPEKECPLLKVCYL